MRRPHLVILAAWFLNVAAWFLPAVTGVGGGRIDPPITGLGAFVMAASAVAGSQFLGTRYEALLAILSVLTELCFVIGSPLALSRGTRPIQRWSAWAACAAFFFNAHWFVRLKPDRWVSSLGIGYFLWWSSFAVLAIGLFDLAGRNNGAELAQKEIAVRPERLR